MRAGWEAQIDFGLASPDVLRLLAEPDRVLHSPAAQWGRRVLQARLRRVAATVRLRVSEQRAAHLLQAAAIGVVQTLLSTPEKSRDAGLADVMFDAVRGQLLTDLPHRDDDGLVGTVIALRAGVAELSALTDAERLLLIEWLDRSVDHLVSSSRLDRIGPGDGLVRD